MKLPFLDYFKKGKAPEPPATITSAQTPKPASERLGKTVMPNMARVVGADAACRLGGGVSAPLTPPPVSAGPRTISLGGEKAAAIASPKPLAPQVAPAAERMVALPLAELLPQIPAELLERREVDPAERVFLSATDLERGLANGRPAVQLRAIYQQAPTIFTSEIGAGDEREVTLPFDRVLQQIAQLHVRSDQVCENVLPHLETPFSQVALEDSERFGTPLTPLPSTAPAVAPESAVAAQEISPIPAPALEQAPDPESVAMPAPAATRRAPIKLPAPMLNPEVELASPPAPAPSAADPAGQAAPPPPIRLPLVPRPIASPAPAPIAPSAEVATPHPAQTEGSPAEAVPNQPAPSSGFRLIKPQVSPNGTGAPATERVPASSGSSVPIPLPAPFAPPPARIPFKVTPPASDLCPPPPLKAAVAAESPPLVFSGEGPRIRLSLRAVLREVPPFQFTGAREDIPESAKIELPFAIVEPQLSLGRVAISPAQFYAALPEEFRGGFVLDEGGMPVSLPLPEVLQNLPDESLQLRADQEQVEVAEIFETPFSQKAAEDAARMHVPAGPIGVEPVVAGGADPGQLPTPAIALPNEKETVSAEQENASAEPELVLAMPASPGSTPPATAAPAITLDAKSIVARANQLPTVTACAAVFSDGLCLAGDIPAEYQADALCAMAPEISRRIGEQLGGANLGPVQSITVFCEKAPVSFFSSENICLAVLHSGEEIAPETRTRLSCITEELAQIYAQPA